MPQEKNTLYCSFCGKSQHEVRKLIAGPTVFICDECVELCMDIIREESKTSRMGSLLLAAGAKGLRYALPHARIMVHQPSGGFQGQASDIERHAHEILELRKRLNQVYADHTGQSVEAIADALERDNFMSAEGAKEFGIIDEVLTTRDELNLGGDKENGNAD